MLTPQQRRTAAGWSYRTLAHNEDLHSAAHSALSPTAAQKKLVTDLTGKILGYTRTNAAPGTAVGSASTAQNHGIPATISAAVNDLNTNTQLSSIQQLLAKVLGQGNGGAPSVMMATSPAQNRYYENKNAIMEAPANIQNQITSKTAQADKTQPQGIMSITPGVPGQYENSVTHQLDQQLAGLFGQQTAAKQAAQSTGWLPYMPQF